MAWANAPVPMAQAAAQAIADAVILKFAIFGSPPPLCSALAGMKVRRASTSLFFDYFLSIATGDVNPDVATT